MIDFLKHTVSLHNYALVLLGVTFSEYFLFVNPLSYAVLTIGISLYYINKRKKA